LQEGDKVLDLGCGVGAVGCLATQQTGPAGAVTFVDSNVRAVALAGHNAAANNVPNPTAIATARMEGLPANGFDVVLANPPYYATSEIASLFIDRSRGLLRDGGRFYLVTKMPNQVGPMVEEAFGNLMAAERRGYVVLEARV
jgi:16S rRNA G1207 methylase RsmC